MPDAFKTCTSCRASWSDRSAFLSDPGIVFVGYQVDFANPDPGYFLFNHDVEGCGTTLALGARLFRDMSSHALDESSEQPENDGVRDCLYTSSGEPCPHRCECSFVKDVCSVLHRVRALAARIGDQCVPGQTPRQ